MADRSAIDLSPREAVGPCRSCGAADVVPIVSGLVGYDLALRNPDVQIGGCVWPDSPDRSCRRSERTFRSAGEGVHPLGCPDVS